MEQSVSPTALVSPAHAVHAQCHFDKLVVQFTSGSQTSNMLVELLKFLDFALNILVACLVFHFTQNGMDFETFGYLVSHLQTIVHWQGYIHTLLQILHQH